MPRDPHYESRPDTFGIFYLDSQTPLYYELRGVKHEQKIIMIIGLASSHHWFDHTADWMAECGFQVE